MNISIIAIGKLKEEYLKNGINYYITRLSSYAQLSLIELPDEKAPEVLSIAEMEQVKEKEGQRILDKIESGTYVIALAIEGQMKTTEQLAKRLEYIHSLGKNNIAFVIGGSLGLSSKVIKRANELLSFSKMTFPHQLMRLILTEQIERALKISRGV